MRKYLVAMAAAVVVVPLVTVGAAAQPAPGGSTAASARTRYVVVYRGSVAQARRVLAALGATVVRENMAIGVATVTTRNTRFESQAAGQPALFGVAPDTAIGRVPGAGRGVASRVRQERAESAAGPAAKARPGAKPRAVPAAEPLSTDQWDMRMIDATPGGSYRVEPGDRRVKVGVIDTGVDSTHPDIAPNFD